MIIFGLFIPGVFLLASLEVVKEVWLCVFKLLVKQFNDEVSSQSTRGWSVEIWHSQNKVPELTLSARQGSILNRTPFCIIAHGITFRFTKRGALGKSQIHLNNTCTKCSAQLMLSRRLTVCFWMYSPHVRGFCRKHFGVALNRSGLLLRLQYYVSELTDFPCRIICFRLTHATLWGSQVIRPLGWDLVILFGLKHFGLLPSGWEKCACVVLVFMALKSVGILMEFQYDLLREL